MGKLTRKLDNLVQEVREQLDRAVLLEPEPSLVAAALNQVSWHLYDLRRRLAKDLRAQGKSWAEVGAVMGISKQSAHSQWHTVDGELLANIAAGYRSRAQLLAEDRARMRTQAADLFVPVAGQLELTEALIERALDTAQPPPAGAAGEG